METGPDRRLEPLSGVFRTEDDALLPIPVLDCLRAGITTIEVHKCDHLITEREPITHAPVRRRFTYDHS